VLENPRSPRVRQVAKLAKKQRRREAQLFLVEGPQAVREALSSASGSIQELFVTASSAEKHPEVMELAARAGVEVFHATDEVLAAMCDTVTPQGVLGVCRFIDSSLSEVLVPGVRNVAVLHEVKDPGNVGNIVRSADAAGADAVILTEASVDIYNPKAVRATTGSLFHLPVVMGIPFSEALLALRGAGLRTCATQANGTDINELAESGTLAQPTAWIFGNEAHGLAAEEAAQADIRVAVPLYGQAESLSLQTAAALCLYQTAFAQQR
jgi:TrmH family RNA methyltransferase